MKRILPALLALAACTPAQSTPAPAPSPAPVQASAPAGRLYAPVEVEEQPALLNSKEVARAIRANYPPLFHDAGIIGEATVRFVVGTDGVPERSTIRVVRVSTPEFTVAAERVAARMRFSPAKLGGAPVRTWVSMPVSFSLP